VSLDSHGARLTRKDVVALAEASEQLAVVAAQIRGSGVRWGEPVVNLLIVVNNLVVRLQEKGSRAFARYLEKHGVQTPQEAPEVEIVSDDVRVDRKVIPDEPEE
jgi:hypothetical protein